MDTMVDVRLNTATSYILLQFEHTQTQVAVYIYLKFNTWKNEFDLFDMAGRSIFLFYILYFDLL